jgi:hypothetical protein
MLARRALQSLFLMAMVLVSVHAASAEEVWIARGGITTFHFNVGLMHDLGIEVSGMQDTVASPPDMELHMEDPYWTFAISEDSDLRFQVNNGIAVPYGILGGALRYGGSIALQIRGASDVTLQHFNIGYVPATVQGPAGPHPSDVLHFGAEGSPTPVVCNIENSMFDFHKGEGVLHIHYMNFSISPEWAASIGRPDLGGWTIGMAEAAVSAEKISGHSSGSVHVPNFVGHLDVALGNVANIAEIAHDGTYPGGTAALSLATTACNVGDTDVPWHAPMAEDHPTIAMALYRSLNGRLEQVGVSWMKHGFYALSNNDCSVCQDHSDGTYLGIACSDTYGISNNSDRTYLGPRKEVNAYKGTWTCTGSHFSGGLPDCIRRHGSTGHGPLDHRLVALDADLALPGATYYYEGYYVVADDIDRSNNIGSKICTMTWNGSVWNFSTPTVDNPLVVGPTINRFGELRSQVPVGAGDGDVILAVQTTDLGAGRYHYEYALFNFNSDRQIRSLTIPIGADSSITNIGFHDSDPDPTNDWQVTIENGTIRWETDTYQNNPDANALGFGLMYNFRFDSSQPPTSEPALLGVFKPGGPTDVSAGTLGPTNTASVGGPNSAASFRLGLARPNPSTGTTTIPFELGKGASVDLSIYDPTGRKVRTLVRSTMDAGSHQADWDGSDAKGRRVPAGVYYYRLRSGVGSAIHSVTLMN